MKWILPLILLLSACSNADETVEMELDDAIEFTQAMSFFMVCEAVEADHGVACGDLEPPTLVITSMLEVVKFKGDYLNGIHMVGEPYVFVNWFAEDIMQTALHETTHYVTYSLGIYSIDPELNDYCDAEKYARKVAEQFDPLWNAQYGCKK